MFNFYNQLPSMFQRPMRCMEGVYVIIEERINFSPIVYLLSVNFQPYRANRTITLLKANASLVRI